MIFHKVKEWIVGWGDHEGEKANYVEYVTNCSRLVYDSNFMSQTEKEHTRSKDLNTGSEVLYIGQYDEQDGLKWLEHSTMPDIFDEETWQDSMSQHDDTHVFCVLCFTEAEIISHELNYYA